MTLENSPYLDRPLLSERERRLVDALRAISKIPDPRSGDRAPIRQARHIALCMLKELDPS